MLRRLALAIVIAALSMAVASCGTSRPPAPQEVESSIPSDALDTEEAPLADQTAASSQQAAFNGADEEGEETTAITLSVGDASFPVRFYDNDAARALIAQMPFTVDMSDLNRNEKYTYLADDLPANATESPATIHAGEIMCWSGNCLVLFYDTFSNSYGGYVRLGYVEDPGGLAAAVGTGAVAVTFSEA